MSDLTMQEIDALADAGEAIMKGIDLGIPMDGLDNLEEMKRRLKCHLRLQQEGSYKVKMDNNIKLIGEEDRGKRKKLYNLVKDVKKVFPDDEDIVRLQMVEGLLSQDGTSNDIRKDCDERMQMLEENECCILVSGEASAGKSSLLNLLLEEEILPSHVLPCTSAITVIKYGKTRHAKVLYRNGQHTDIPTLDEDGLKQLHSVAFIEENAQPTPEDIYQKRRDGHDIVEIQVYLPLTFLKSGLVLLDTPGIGENEFLENYLIDYIRTHQILGFQYIIMSDAAKCVAEDRLVALMSLILKHQTSSTQLIKFDPRAAVFVCNRWDMVKDKQTAKTAALESLKRVWPEFQISQNVYFSTFHAKREVAVNPGYITENYIELQDSLSKLVAIAMDRRIKASFRWLGSVLQRTVHYLRTIVRGIDMSEHERDSKKIQTKKKLHALKTKAEAVTKKLRNEVDKAVHDICEKVREYLKTPQARLKLTTNWGKDADELPDLYLCAGGWDWVKRHIDGAIDSRLIDLLEDWETVERCIPELETKLCRDAKLDLCELESELSQIENDVQDDTVSMGCGSALLTRSGSVSGFAELMDIPEPEKTMPKKILTMVGKLMKPFSPDKKGEKKIQKYLKDSASVAQKRAEKRLKSLQQDKEELQTFINQLMQRPLKFIQQLETKIPNMIKSNEMLLNKFEQEILSEASSRKRYIEMMTKMECIRRGLLEFGESFLFANDFDANDVQLLNITLTKQIEKKDSLKDILKRGSTSEDNEISLSPYGLWTSVHTGKLKGHEDYVSVKIYSPNAGVENTTQEIAKLRCLLHKDVYIAEFLGIYQTPDTETPAQLYNGRLVSVRRYVQENRNKYDADKLLLDSLAGLRYLHTKELVHMELTQDTLTVNAETGEVKMSGACLPRKAKLPLNVADSVCSDFVYLPKEVLHGNVYTADCDMYCFALMCLELYTNPLRVFEEERLLTLEQFRSFDISPILESKLGQSPFQKEFKQYLRKCVDIYNISARPSALDMWNEQNRIMEKKTRRYSAVNGTVAPRHLWSGYRATQKLKL